MESETKNTEVVWKGYLKLWDSMGQDDQERIRNEILCFSAYMGHANAGYHYNKTYLPKFTEEFLEFLSFFSKKYYFVEELFTLVKSEKNITLKIDRYWQIETATEWREVKKTCLGDIKMVCTDSVLIECSSLCGTKRYIYQKKIPLGDITKEQKQDILNEFRVFLKTHSLSETKEKIDE